MGRQHLSRPRARCESRSPQAPRRRIAAVTSTWRIAACLTMSALVTSAHAEARRGADFSTGLRRSITIQGEEGRRYSIADRMAHYLVPGVSVAIIDRCRVVE